MSDCVGVIVALVVLEFLTVVLWFVDRLVARRQAEVTVKETGRIVRPLDYVRLDGADWLVIQADLETIDRRQQLRLLESA